MSTTRLPAFPTNRVNMNGEVVPDEEGMTLRDYFAAKAMPAVYRDFWDDVRAGRNGCVPQDWKMGIALDAYDMADAMLAARDDDSPQAADTDALGDLRAYFPDAETLHDCYRRIEELERDAARYRAWRDGSCDEPSRFARALAPCLTPQEIDQALDAMMKEPRP